MGCKTVGFTPLDGASDIEQFYISGNKLIGPDAGNLNVGIYPYPKGGSAEMTLTGFSSRLARPLFPAVRATICSALGFTPHQTIGAAPNLRRERANRERVIG
jgi:hypothetical protein